VKEWSPGRLVANLFAYNGGFSVSAALGGAASVCTVDVAADAVEDAQENFRLNGLDPKHYEFVVADVFKWTPSTQLDFLILDPPSMAKSHKAEEGAKRGYVKLHRKFAPHVARGGLLATASCTARLTRSDWEDSVRSGLVREGRWVWQWKSGEPLDHPIGLMHGEGEYLKFALLRRL
jgi:23S rRNA (cytosine1962-C5)-methyltransferase